MQPKLTLLALMSLLDLLILFDLVAGLSLIRYAPLWVVLHVTLVVCGTVLLSQLLLNTKEPENKEKNSQEATSANMVAARQAHPYRLYLFVGLLAFIVPGVGMGGISLAMLYGLHVSRSRSYVAQYWQATPVAALPYVAPEGRSLRTVDSRGFSEHLLYSTDDQDIYRKVLAAANVRTSLAIDTLKQAMQHTDERVRLTAYKTLDKKVTELNKQIQTLEKSVAEGAEEKVSDKWLQIASNYWELITLEGGEAVARKQLLASAAKAAIKAVEHEPGNRNAHLVLGRVFLAQGDVRRAAVALDRSQSLGMPADKVLPYLAECAFVNRDFLKVRNLLASLDSAIVVYPPLSHVTRYWA